MEKRRVVITGLGTVNPLGNNVADSWAAARAGKCGIGPITQFDTTDFKCKLAGEVKDFDPETVVDKKEVRKMARFTLLALGAAAEAIADSGLDTEAEGKDIGVILSSGIGGLSITEAEHDKGKEKGWDRVSPFYIPTGICNMAAGQIAIHTGFRGMCSCPVTACTGGTNAVGDAFHYIRDGYADVMLCGGTESAVTPWKYSRRAFPAGAIRGVWKGPLTFKGMTLAPFSFSFGIISKSACVSPVITC